MDLQKKNEGSVYNFLKTNSNNGENFDIVLLYFNHFSVI